jgi:hypothetical protein
MANSSTPAAFGTVFWKVEHALLAAFGIPQEEQERLRTRYRWFQRRGLLGPENAVGHGGRVVYGPTEIGRLILAFELAQMDVPRELILRCADELWPKLQPAFDLAGSGILHHPPGDADVILLLAGMATITHGVSELPTVRYTKLGELQKGLGPILTGDQPRLIALNLSARLRVFHSALADVHLLPRRPAEARKAGKAKRRARAAAERRIVG